MSGYCFPTDNRDQNTNIASYTNLLVYKTHISSKVHNNSLLIDFTGLKNYRRPEQENNRVILNCIPCIYPIVRETIHQNSMFFVISYTWHQLICQSAHFRISWVHLSTCYTTIWAKQNMGHEIVINIINNYGMANMHCDPYWTCLNHFPIEHAPSAEKK